MMNIKDYANAVAKAMGEGFEVNEVNKPNGIVVYGITRKDGVAGRTIPQVYVDGCYKGKMEVEEAAKMLKEQFEEHNNGLEFDTSLVSEWDKAKEFLRARLYNESTKAEVQKSAAEYGYRDLIIVPYLDNVIQIGDVCGGIKVTEQILEVWDKTAEEVIAIAEENSEKEAEIKTMAETLAELSGMPVEMFEMTPPIYVVSNTKKSNGAYGVIAKRKEIAKKFEDTGFVVLPSSVHEVLVIPNDEDIDAMTEMVQEVNGGYVAPMDILSDHAYEFVA